MDRDVEVAIELLKQEKGSQERFVNMSGCLGISNEHTDKIQGTIEALDLAIDSLQEPTLVRCKDCRHNNNCDIQFAATAGENFGCLAGERSEYVEPTGGYEFFGDEYAKEGDAETATTTDCISRADIEYHTQLEARGNGRYDEVEVAYKSDIESLPPVTPAVNTDDVEHIARLIKDAFRSGFKEGERLMRKVRDGADMRGDKE